MMEGRIKRRDEDRAGGDEDDKKESTPGSRSALSATKTRQSEAGVSVLKRPVIVCADTSSNAWGDPINLVPPLSYTLLTMKARTTMSNALYQHATQQLMSDAKVSKLFAKQQWFLQSAYALGFGEEPELTSFSRYWPQHT